MFGWDTFFRGDPWRFDFFVLKIFKNADIFAQLWLKRPGEPNIVQQTQNNFLQKKLRTAPVVHIFMRRSRTEFSRQHSPHQKCRLFFHYGNVQFILRLKCTNAEIYCAHASECSLDVLPFYSKSEAKTTKRNRIWKILPWNFTHAVRFTLLFGFFCLLLPLFFLELARPSGSWKRAAFTASIGVRVCVRARALFSTTSHFSWFVFVAFAYSWLTFRFDSDSNKNFFFSFLLHSDISMLMVMIMMMVCAELTIYRK